MRNIYRTISETKKMKKKTTKIDDNTNISLLLKLIANSNSNSNLVLASFTLDYNVTSQIIFNFPCFDF